MLHDLKHLIFYYSHLPELIIIENVRHIRTLGKNPKT